MNGLDVIFWVINGLDALIEEEFSSSSSTVK